MDTFAAEITLSMRFSFFAGLLFLMGSSNAGAQESFTLSGQLRDADTGEDLPFAAIVAPDIEAVGNDLQRLRILLNHASKGSASFAVHKHGICDR